MGRPRLPVSPWRTHVGLACRVGMLDPPPAPANPALACPCADQLPWADTAAAAVARVVPLGVFRVCFVCHVVIPADPWRGGVSSSRIRVDSWPRFSGRATRSPCPRCEPVGSFFITVLRGRRPPDRVRTHSLCPSPSLRSWSISIRHRPPLCVSPPLACRPRRAVVAHRRACRRRRWCPSC